MNRRKNSSRMAKSQRKYIRRLKMEYRFEAQPKLVAKIQEAYARHESKTKNHR